MTINITKKTLYVLITVAVMILAFIVWKMSQQPVNMTPQAPAVNAIKIDWHELSPEKSFVAKIESRDRVGLRARVTGFLQEQLFKEGDYIEKDQPLFVIEQVNFQSAVKEAQANYDRAAARAKNAAVQYERTEKLYRTKDVSKSRLDDAEANNETAKADLAQMEARLALAQKDLEYTTIKAPMSGKIGEALFSVGELISPQSGILANVVTVDPMDAIFSVSENELLLARRQFVNTEDIEAIFITTDGHEYPEIGTINFVDVALDEGMNTLKMKASFPNPEHKLLSGQYGRIKLRPKKPTKMIIIPQKAVQRTANSEFVMVIRSDNTIEQRTIQTGTELPDYQVELIDGLKVGESIVVEGFQKITVGATVNPIYNK